MAIPFVQWVVPMPVRVSSSRSLLSQQTWTNDVPGWMFDGTNTSFSTGGPLRNQLLCHPGFNLLHLCGWQAMPKAILEVTQLLRFQKCVSWQEAALHAWQFLCDRESHSGLCPAPPKEHGSDPIQKQALPSHAERETLRRVVAKEKQCKEVEERCRYLSTGRLVTDIRWLRGKGDTRCAVHNIWTKAQGSSEQSWTRGFFEFRRLSVDIHWRSGLFEIV